MRGTEFPSLNGTEWLFAVRFIAPLKMWNMSVQTDQTKLMGNVLTYLCSCVSPPLHTCIVITWGEWLLMVNFWWDIVEAFHKPEQVDIVRWLSIIWQNEGFLICLSFFKYIQLCKLLLNKGLRYVGSETKSYSKIYLASPIIVVLFKYRSGVRHGVHKPCMTRFTAPHSHPID